MDDKGNSYQVFPSNEFQGSWMICIRIQSRLQEFKYKMGSVSLKHILKVLVTLLGLVDFVNF